jgi:hypothetical protein
MIGGGSDATRVPARWPRISRRIAVHLMTLHLTGGRGSAEWFHDDDWLSFNMRQNGHEQNFGRYAATRADYDRQPVKPVIDGSHLRRSSHCIQSG